MNIHSQPVRVDSPPKKLKHRWAHMAFTEKQWRDLASWLNSCCPSGKCSFAAGQVLMIAQGHVKAEGWTRCPLSRVDLNAIREAGRVAGVTFKEVK